MHWSHEMGQFLFIQSSFVLHSPIDAQNLQRLFVSVQILSIVWSKGENVLVCSSSSIIERVTGGWADGGAVALCIWSLGRFEGDDLIKVGGDKSGNGCRTNGGPFNDNFENIDISGNCVFILTISEIDLLLSSDGCSPEAKNALSSSTPSPISFPCSAAKKIKLKFFLNLKLDFHKLISKHN